MNKQTLRVSRVERICCRKRWLTGLLSAISLLACSQARAGLPVDSAHITMHLERAPIVQAFNIIRQQTPYRVIYDNSLVKAARPVTVSVENEKLPVVLNLLFRGQPFEYRVIDKSIIITPRKPVRQSAPAPTSPAVTDTIITGRVVADSTLLPLAGATVTVRETNSSIATDNEGRFRLALPTTGATLVISYVGYESQTIRVNKSSGFLVRVVLAKTQQEMEGVTVVNTGYETLAKERATGAFEKIDNELFNRNISTDIISRLEGLSPSILFDKRKGDQQRITIRGRSTIFGDTQPLIVVDNFPYEGDINNINPNDVESITFLKDAAAASIWGVRSGNGVIVITTKKGKFNQPAKIGINTNITFGQKPDAFYIPNISTSDFIDVEKYLFTEGYYSAEENNTSYPILSPVVELLIKQRDGIISEAEANGQINALRSKDVRNDFNKYLFKNSINQQYSLNISGGSEKMSYYISGGYDKNINTYGAQYERKNIQNQTTVAPLKNLSVSFSFNYSQSASVVGRPTYNTISSGRKRLYPYAQFADDFGNPLPIVYGNRMNYVDTVGGGLLLDWKYRPLEEFSLRNSKNSAQDLLYGVQTSYKLSNSLNVNIQYQYQGTKSQSSTLNSINSYYTRDLINRFSQINDNEVFHAIPLGGIIKLDNSTFSANSVRGIITYNKQLGSFTINSLGGAEYRSLHTNGNSLTEYGYNNDLLTFTPVDYITEFPQFIEPSSLVRIPNENDFTDLTRRFTSIYANATLSFKNKYFASGSVRKDASNVFGVDANQRGVPLWSTGFAWNIHNERFFTKNFLSYLRLSTTFGYNGNIDNTLSAYPLMLYVNGADINGNQYGIILNPPNHNLRWERIKTINLSLDFKTKKDIFSGNISYFLKKGMDLIGNSSIDPTTGILSFKGNIADMTSKGVESSITAKVVDRAIRWNSTLLFSWNNNRVTKYEAIAKIANAYIGTETIVVPLQGKPLFGVYSYKWGGLDPVNGDPQGFVNKQLSKDYLDIISNTNLDDLVYHGSAIPTTFGVLRNDFLWKKISLSFSLAYKLGYYFRRNSINYTSLFNAWQGYSDFAQRWKKPGDERNTNVPSMPSVSSINSQRDLFYILSETLVEKGDNIKFQDLSVAYSIEPVNSKSFFTTLELYFYARDLGIIWSANKYHIDPDYQDVLPLRKSVSIGVRATF